MGMTFEWDESKAALNEQKHGVSFLMKRQQSLRIPLSLTIADEAHSDVEDRFVDIGESRSGRLLVMFYTERGETIRLISGRVATRTERRAYEQQT